MALEIASHVLGPLENNTYLLADQATRKAVLVDPAMGCLEVYQEATLAQKLTLEAVWLTHAHFDHFAGVYELLQAGVQMSVRLHPLDLKLWEQIGLGELFGVRLPALPPPEHTFSHGQRLQLGEAELEVLHTPGHSPGHVCLYSRAQASVLCGDLIFYHSIGRSDLPGGNEAVLLDSIATHILPLPDETRLLSGHGPQTRVGEERANNPFLAALR